MAVCVPGISREEVVGREVDGDRHEQRPLGARLALWRVRLDPVLQPALMVALLAVIAIWPQGGAQRFIYFQF